MVKGGKALERVTVHHLIEELKEGAIHSYLSIHIYLSIHSYLFTILLKSLKKDRVAGSMSRSATPMAPFSSLGKG